MKSNEVMEQMNKIKKEIEILLDQTKGREKYNEIDEKVKYGSSPDERMLKEEFCGILENLAEIKTNLDYLNAPIVRIESLYRNNSGRYASSSQEYRSGSKIEILLKDPFDNETKWAISRIEHDEQDYYVVGYQYAELQGAKVRFRKS